MSVAPESIRGGNFAKRPQGIPSRMPGPMPQPIRGQGGSWGVSAPIVYVVQTPESLTCGRMVDDVRRDGLRRRGSPRLLLRPVQHPGQALSDDRQEPSGDPYL